MFFDCGSECILQDSRVALRPMEMKYVGDLSKIAFEERDLLLYSPRQIHRIDLLNAYFEDALEARRWGQRYPFVVFDKQSGQLAGSTSYGNISNDHARLEIGWTWIGQRFQRTGLNRHAKYLMLKFAFEDLGCKRIELKTDARNTQSRTAISAIGAKYEGCLRSHTVMHDGFRRDTIYYAILADEWPHIKATVFASVQDNTA